MNYKLGQPGLKLDSIEGRVAFEVYDKKAGDSVFRRITPIVGLLIWAGVCVNDKKHLKLSDSCIRDEDIIRLHWNYFLALEEDLKALSRYIEFDISNFKTYSSQCAHLLLSASSEIDVVAKALCSEIDLKSKTNGIHDYKRVITSKYPQFVDEIVNISRYNISLTPWKEWDKEKGPPKWWTAYNKVKHERINYYQRANLENVVNALSALLLTIFYFRSAQIENLRPMGSINPLDVLQPDPLLLKLDPKL